LFSEEFEEIVREVLVLSGFHFSLSSEWGARAPAGRLAIRKALMKRLAHFQKQDTWIFSSEAKALLDLNLRPHVSFASISISHCPYLGGFVFSLGAQEIGFDIEVISRLEDNLAIKRVSSPKELSILSDRSLTRTQLGSLLWSAKESSFKALTLSEVTTLSGIETHDWSELTHQFKGGDEGIRRVFRFKARSIAQPASLAVGLVASTASYSLAIAIRND
jgi:phosphopantetheinyl transferase (holo-ACP synthase)